MWDSAKKPIKIRSVLQSNGMRHFIVNEETDEVYSNILHQQQQKRKNSNTNSRAVTDKNEGLDQQRQLKLPPNEKHNVSLDDSSKIAEARHFNNPPPLIRSNSHSFGENEERRLSSSSENCENFFGVAGSGICNSKKHKGHYNRYFHQFPHYVKEANLIHLNDNSVMNKCPHIKEDMLDLIPVKSPVIKKLINGRANSSISSSDLFQASRARSSHSKAVNSPSTTLCSRIMTWIDLEVKRNAVKGRSSGSSLTYSSADLNIVNELNGFQSESSSPSSSSINSGSTTPSGDAVCASSSSNSSSDSASNDSRHSSTMLNLPKLVPCWRKDGKSAIPETGSKAKKSVRISDDLPRWGKMKRRLRKQDRSLSFNELYNDDELSVSAFMTGNRQTEIGPNFNSRNQTNCQKQYSSILNNKSVDDRHTQEKVPLWADADADLEKRESFVVCDEDLAMSGRVQVHIFLPQTENSTVTGKGLGAKTCDTESNLSGRSEDSTV